MLNLIPNAGHTGLSPEARLDQITDALRDCRFDPDWDTDPPNLVIHRDMIGYHRLGKDCWCCPHVVSSADRRSPRLIAAELDALERRQ